jgi:hypothetical protein
MCPTSAAGCLALARAFGSKAANLGFLTSRQVLGRTTDASSLSHKYGYDLAPAGVGVPISFYHDVVDHAPNGAVRDAIAALVSAEKGGTASPADRDALIAAVQEAFYHAQLPPGLVDNLRQKLTQSLPGVNKLKVRSSANAEDLPNFDGAGLYDSYAANLDATDNADGSCAVQESPDGVTTKREMSPKTLACALKGVYASAWNRRAVEERTFARLDHATVGMGLAINPRYGSEVANSVVVTRVIGSQGVIGYTMSSQQGENLVTNPTPGTLAESLVAAFVDELQTTYVVLHYAVPVAGQAALETLVVSQEDRGRVLEISRAVERAYCRAKDGYYAGACEDVIYDRDKPRSLDLEFKFLDDGHLVCKQVREFSGR